MNKQLFDAFIDLGAKKNKHNFTKRIAEKGIDLWQCQACFDQGPLKELMSRECSHFTTDSEMEKNLLAALEIEV